MSLDKNGNVIKAVPVGDGKVAVTREFDVLTPFNRKERRTHAARNRKGRK